MKKWFSTVALVPIALTALACSSTEQPAATTPQTSSPAAASSPTTTQATRNVSPQGNIIKQVGEVAGIVDEHENDTITWVITSFDVDGPCPSGRSSTPEHGHLVIAQLEVNTTESARPEDLLSFHPANDWSIVGADGVTETEVSSTAGFNCSGQAVPRLAPASVYKFPVVFDTRNAEGTVQLRPSFGNGGWEWNY